MQLADFVCIIIDCQPFQHPLFLVLLRISLSACIPNPNTCTATNNIIINRVIDVRRINWIPHSNYCTLLKLKSSLIALRSHEQLPAKSWRIIRTILHSKACASLTFESQRKSLHRKELSLGCSVTIANCETFIFASWSMADMG